jgi:hypothetical protein
LQHCYDLCFGLHVPDAPQSIKDRCGELAMFTCDILAMFRS